MNKSLTTTSRAGGIETIYHVIVPAFLLYLDRSEATARSYKSNLKQFISWSLKNGIQEPNRADVIRFREDMLKTCRPGTVAQYIRTLKAFYSWGTLEGYFQKDITAYIRAPKVDNRNPRKRHLEPSEVVAIEESIEAGAGAQLRKATTATKDRAGKIDRATEQSKRLFAMYLLTVTRGLRCIELSRACIKDLRTEHGETYLYIWGKGHTEPDTGKPLAPEVVAAIHDYLKTRHDAGNGSAPLFAATGNRSHGRRIAASTIGKMLKNAMIEAGINETSVTAHSLRHTTAQAALAASDNNVFLAQLALRHDNINSTKRYIRVTSEVKRAEAELTRRIYDYLHQEPAPVRMTSGALEGNDAGRRLPIVSGNF